MKEKFMQLKIWVVEAVIWAEKELKGKPGIEKKKAVITQLSTKLVSFLPWYAAWTKGIVAPMFIGFIVDWAHEKLGFLSDWNFAEAELDNVRVAEIASVLAAPASVMADVSSKSTDERIDELYQKYGITPDVVEDAAEAHESVTLPQTDNFDNQLSKNLSVKEITCKCGCGFNILHPKMINTFQALRDYINKPIHITSGCRCPEWNLKVGGVNESAHIYGMALDMYVNGLSARQFGEIIKRAEKSGVFGYDFRYCYLVDNNVVHVGVDETARSGKWGF